jgi:transposase-like protein
MPKALSAAKRRLIEQAIRDGGQRNTIAREHDVSPGTVTRIAQQAKIEGAFDRTHAEKATRARQADVAGRMAELESHLLDDAAFYRRAMRAQLSRAMTDQVKTQEAKDIAIIFGIASDKLLAFQKSREPTNVEAGRTLIADLVDEMRGQVGDAGQ